MNLADYVMSEALSGGGSGGTTWTVRLRWDSSYYYTTLSAYAVAYGIGSNKETYGDWLVVNNDTVRVTTPVVGNLAHIVVVTQSTDSGRVVDLAVSAGEIESTMMSGVYMVTLASDNALITITSHSVS